MKMINKFYFLIPVILQFVSCMQDDPFKESYIGFQPANRNDGWIVSTPEAEQMDRKLLEQAYRLMYEDDRFTMARSLIVVKNGKIVAEAYPHDQNDIDRIDNIQSMTKSFTSILTGIALEKGYIDSLDQTLYSIYPENFSDNLEKSEITIRNALTMTTGIAYDNDVNTLHLYQDEGNSIEYILSLPMEYAPGNLFHYHDGAPHLISAAIQKRYGHPFSDFASEFLFEPLQIRDWKWESSTDGINFGAFSLFLKPRDLAKFGQMLLQLGNWNDRQIVDREWITEASRTHVESGSGAPYGYYFWIYPWFESYAADGHGGQRVMVTQGKNLVVVYTAWPYTSGEFFDNFEDLASLIIASCE